MTVKSNYVIAIATPSDWLKRLGDKVDKRQCMCSSVCHVIASQCFALVLAHRLCANSSDKIFVSSASPSEIGEWRESTILL